jgi:hypothetical protein
VKQPTKMLWLERWQRWDDLGSRRRRPKMNQFRRF